MSELKRFLNDELRLARKQCKSGRVVEIESVIKELNNRPSPWVSVSMKQIKSIAEFAGFAVHTFDYSDNEMNETEFVISEYEKVDNEDGTYYEGMTVHCAEYPEEGFMALEDKPSLPQPPKEIE